MKYLGKFVIAVLCFGFFSCVPLKQFTDIKQTADNIQKENEKLKEENRKLTVDNTEQSSKIFAFQKRVISLEDKVKALTQEKDDLKSGYEKFSKHNKDLEKQIALLKDGSSEEISKLLSELQLLQTNLQEREDKVREAEEQIEIQKQKLKQAQDELKMQEQKLAETEKAMNAQQARMMELQNALDKQKSAVESLKSKLNAALRGFYDQGLSVYEKNGKVYVSLEEQLLFKTGSYSLDPKGQEAIISLSGVLAANPEINIMVEGHTDDVPLNGAGQVKDNWDLSVMRATAVTKIILGNSGIDPKRITSSGRGEFIPLDPGKTADARKKNRRTEIILTPDLSEVFDILKSN